MYLRKQCQRFALLIGLVAALLWPSISHADNGEGASFTMSPQRYDPSQPATQNYFIYDVSPGQVVENEVVIKNVGTESGTVRLYPVDGVTADTSGTVFPASSVLPEKVGTWIEIAAQEITLAPGEEQAVPFTVSVPLEVRAGEHVGGVVAEDILLRGAPTNAGMVQVKMQNRVALAVQVNVVGSSTEEVIVQGVQAAIDHGYQTLQIAMANTGDVMSRPQGTLLVTDLEGNTLWEKSLALDTLLPGAQISYPVTVEGEALAEGSYRAAVALRYGEQGEAQYQGEFSVTREQVQTLYESRVPEQSLPPLEQPDEAPATADAATGVQLSPTTLLLIAGVVLVLLLGIVGAFVAGRRTASG